MIARTNLLYLVSFIGLGAVFAASTPAQADGEAVLQGLDKTTARVATIDAPLDRQVRYGDLLITAKACVRHPPEETPESAAFLVIDLLPPDAGPKTQPERIFSGWMFASSPAVSALENPVYDVTVLGCKDDSAATPAPAPAVTTGGGSRRPPR